MPLRCLKDIKKAKYVVVLGMGQGAMRRATANKSRHGLGEGRGREGETEARNHVQHDSKSAQNNLLLAHIQFGRKKNNLSRHFLCHFLCLFLWQKIAEQTEFFRVPSWLKILLCDTLDTVCKLQQLQDSRLQSCVVWTVRHSDNFHVWPRHNKDFISY